MSDALSPAEIVAELDKFIVGQNQAKRATAIALRNRYRRQKLPDAMRDEVMPKNILMIGPTGVGKTEIARRLAKIVGAPFIKVEATKFTEVGYVGRDVESIIRDLTEIAVTQVQDSKMDEVEERARHVAEERILDVLCQPAVKEPAAAKDSVAVKAADGAEASPSVEEAADDAGAPAVAAEAKRTGLAQRRRLARKLAAHQLEDRVIEIEVEEELPSMMEIFSGTGLEEVGINLSEVFDRFPRTRRRQRRVSVSEARHILTQEETERLVDIDQVYNQAIGLVEESGIVFLDEIDKVAGPRPDGVGPDVSGEGVQRDMLPIVEGSTVMTRYGAVQTDHILFIAAGAFNVAKPSDLIPELQGRFPIRVELKPLREADLERILTEPDNSLVKQYTALLETEAVTLEWTPDGIGEIARQAMLVNEQDENIGARRLHTICETVLEDISFKGADLAGQTLVIDRGFVLERLADLVRNPDLRKYIL